MQSRPNRSIQKKITLVILLISSAVLVIACVSLFAFQAWSIRKSFKSQLSVTGEITANNVAAAVMFKDEERAAQTLAGLKAMPQIVCACIVLSDGTRLTHFGVEDAGEVEKTINLDSGFRAEGNQMLLAQPIIRDGQRHGTLYLSADFGSVYSGLLKLYGSILAAVLAASLLLAFLLSRRFQGFVTGPILRLTETAHRIADAKDYSVRAETTGNDEVAVLTTAFNQMLAQIHEQDTALQGAQSELREKLKSIQREVADRQRAEAAQAQLSAIIDGTPDFVGSADTLGRVIYLNPAARRMVGLEKNADISSMKISDLHPGWAARIVSTEGIPAAIHSGSWAGETAIRHRDGTEMQVSQVIIAHKNPAGGLEHLSTVMRDISEQKAAEEALRVAELKFRGLVEQLPAITYHAALGESCSWTYVSPQVFTLLGFTQEEWLASDRLWFEHIHPEDRKIPIEAEAAARRTGQLVAEYRMFTKDGELRWFRDQAVFVTATENSHDALYGVMMDITEAKAADTRLAELNTKLLETSRMAGMAEVATGVLHNVGNVLNSVNVSAGVVLDKLRRSKASKVSKAAELLISRNGDLAEYLTQDPNGQKLPGYLVKLGTFLTTENTELLAEVDQLSHNIEHIKEVVAMQQSYAKVSGVFEDLHLDRLVDDAIAMNAGACERHGITLERRFSPAPPVRVDRHRVLQILINLIRNSKYALDDGKRPDKRLTISIEPADDSSVSVRVADNGVGISPENLTRIFGHGFTTRKDGHGFGLHSGANAAKEMGGSLSVHSDGLGHGAVFTLNLPVASTKPTL